MDFLTLGIGLLYLIVTVITMTLVASAVALFVLAARKGPAHRQCDGCDYPLGELKRNTGRCPECGVEFDLNIQDGRRSRAIRGRSILAGTACLLMLAAALFALLFLRWLATHFVGP